MYPKTSVTDQITPEKSYSFGMNCIHLQEAFTCGDDLPTEEICMPGGGR